MKFALPWALLLCAAPALAKTVPPISYEFQAVAPSQAASPDLDLDSPLNANLAAALGSHRDTRKLGLSKAELDKRITAMTEAGLLLKQKDGSYRTTFPIIDRAAAKSFAEIDHPLAERMAKMVESHAQALRNAAPGLPSLILFSDLPFDRWQVRHVRGQFLGGYPPPRGGREFYLADVELDPASSLAAAGFYSHGEQTYGGLTLVTYGNEKNADPFGGRTPEDIARLLTSYVAFVRTGAAPDAELSKLGFIRAGKPTVPVIKRAVYAGLPETAKTVTNDLLALLEADRTVAQAAYNASPMASTVSFREFGLWWYHFLYAEATGRLIKDKLITPPPSGGAMMVVTAD